MVNNDVSQIVDTHLSLVDNSKCLANELNLDFSQAVIEDNLT